MYSRIVLAALTACGLLMSSSALFAQTQFGLLSNTEKRIYHACLYAHFIDNYCRSHAWGYFPQSFLDCVIANGGCECAIVNGGYWGPDIYDACHALRARR